LSTTIRPPPDSTPLPYTTLFRSATAPGLDQPERQITLASKDRPIRLHPSQRRPARLPVDALQPTITGVFNYLRPHAFGLTDDDGDRKSTRLNSSHGSISYAVFCL